MNAVDRRADPARVKFLVLVGALLAAKIAIAALLPLFGDEAFYWQESTHPGWAYSDLPAATAWLAWLGTAIGGDTLLGLRWPFLAMGTAVPFLVVAVARRELGEAAGWRAGTVAALLPLAATLGVLALPDVPLTFAALLCLDAASRLLRRVGAAACIELACGLVLGGLTHYRFALVVAAGALALLASRDGRAALRDARVWAAVAVGALAWLPLAWWNLAHGDAGLRFQLVDRHPWRFHLSGAWFPLVQLVCVTPLLLVALLGALREAWRERARAGAALVLVAGGLPIAAYGVLGFFADAERVSFHWTLPGWLALAVFAPPVLARWPRPWRIATQALAAAGTLLACAYLVAALAPGLRARLAGTSAYPDNFAGWGEVAAAVDARLAQMPDDTRVVADNFMLGAQLGFARGRGDVPVLDHPLNHKHGRAPQLALWGLTETDLSTRDAPVLLVVEDSARPAKQRLEAYRGLCDVAGGLRSPEVLNVDGGRKRFLLFALPPTAPGTAGAGCVLPAIAWIDAPAADAEVSGGFAVAGWAFKDGAGVARVEVTLDGATVADAAYGRPAPWVAEYWKVSEDPAHPAVGFDARLDAAALPAGRHRLGIVVHGRDGSREPWPTQWVRVVHE
ncbi:glycosyltransferase family 39 protein [Coralloluteibacterium stylophorae]|uniref:Glycosyltransferase family 39 protein n=1 Tax=Coralloluteibacterium stylophorae TaxID=1776034 RepID=A0A8J7VVR5_9GAMM|nr:glycosyltransferase family 39 protein [Coralloluteibacterium stylophorae]